MTSTLDEAPAVSAARAARVGDEHGVLTSEQVRDFIAAQLEHTDIDGKSVCILVPDGTRTCPLPLLLGAVHRALHGRVTRMTTLIALGTHQPMSRGRSRPAPRLRGGAARGRPIPG